MDPERPSPPDAAPEQGLRWPAGRCANCGALREGPFCGRCGQPALPERLRLRDAMRRWASGVVDHDRGFLHTLTALFRRPAGVVSDYLSGRTIPYTNPAKYFLLAIALLQVVAFWSGLVGEFSSGFLGDSADTSALSATLDRFFVLFAAPAVLVLAVLQRLLFRRHGRNIAEHLVFAFFVCGQQALLWTPLLPLTAIADDTISTGAFSVGLAITGGYYLHTAHRFFSGSAAGDILRGLAVLTLAVLLSGTLLALALAIVQAAGA